MKKLFFTFLIFCLPLSAGAFLSTPNVPIDDPVYRQIDRLVALGLARDVIYGQRPWSRGEIARLITNARKKYEEIGTPISPDDRELSLRIETDELLDRLEARFHDELVEIGGADGHRKIWSVHPLSYVEGQFVFVDAEARTIPLNGLGSIDGMIAPLTAYREGLHFPDGAQFAVETEHYVRATRFVSAYARPRFQLEIRDGGDGQFHAYVQQLYGKMTVPHFELEVGRDSLEWGQGEFGGILLSNNARPLDMIKLSNPSPTILPWIFKYLGPFRYTIFLVNMGPEREFPHSFLTGFKLSIKPVSFFEMGFAQLMMLGGDGAPGPITVGNALGEFFGKRGGSGNLTNRETGFDFRFYVPRWRQMQVYVDVQFEDDSKDRLFQITDLSNYQAGFYFPSLNTNGTASLRLEYRHGSPFFYRHGTFTTGMALNRRILGDELGPQADGGYASIDYEFSEKFWTKYSFGYERRDGDLLTQVNVPSRRVAVVIPVPAEHRLLIDIQGKYSFNPKCHLDLELGYQYAHNFNFIPSDNRSGFLVMSSLRFDLF